MASSITNSSGLTDSSLEDGTCIDKVITTMLNENFAKVIKVLKGKSSSSSIHY